MADHRVVPVRTYVSVFGALVLLTALTVAAAHVNLAGHRAAGMGNVYNDAVAIGIAVTKASLVILFFMHVKGSTRLIKITVLASLVFLVLLFSLSFTDYLTRGWFGPPGK